MKDKPCVPVCVACTACVMRTPNSDTRNPPVGHRRRQVARGSNTLTAEQKALDHAARLEIIQELGHLREQITTVYLGR